MKRSVIAVSLFLAAVLTAPCSGTAQAETAPVEVGQVYTLIGIGVTGDFKILEIGKGGFVKVQLLQRVDKDLTEGSTWWYNLNQVLFIRAK